MTETKEEFMPFAIDTKKNGVSTNSTRIAKLKGSGTEIPIHSKVRVFILILFLFSVSSLFQTLAWYHNIDRGMTTFWLTFGTSMSFVVLEYLFMLPANQIGAQTFTLFQLGLLAELANWVVFLLYVSYVKKESFDWKCWISIILITIAVYIGYS